jgi:patatin-like phospholipase/acyl hydrolase
MIVLTSIDTVAQATIVAPSYFEPIEVNNWRFGDGGYGCNNPAAEAYFEARALHNESHSAIALLVSLGTGDTDISRFTDQKGFSGRLRQYVNAGKVLASDKHGVSKHLRRITDGIENSYYRFNAGGRLGDQT